MQFDDEALGLGLLLDSRFDVALNWECTTRSMLSLLDHVGQTTFRALGGVYDLSTFS